MPSNQYIFDFTDGGTLDRLGTRVQGFQTRVEALTQSLQRRGSSGSALEQTAENFNTEINESVTRVNQLLQLVDRLSQAIATAPPLGGIRDPDTGRFAKRDEIVGRRDQASRDLAAERVRLSQILTQSEVELTNAFRQDLVVQESLNTVYQQREGLIRRLEGLAGGSQSTALQEVAEKRRNALLQRQQELVKQIAQERLRLERGTPDNVGVRNFKILEDSQKRLNQLTAQRTNILEQQRLVRAQIAKQDLQQREATEPPTEDESAALDKAREAAKQRLVELTNQQTTAEQAINEELGRQEEALRVIASLEEAGGVGGGTAELQRRLLEVNNQLASLDTSEIQELSRVAGIDLTQAFDGLLARAQALASSDLAPDEEVAQFQQLNEEARRLFATLNQLETAQIPDFFSQEELFRGLPTFERTVLGAFQGIGQRFRATLQFALSGALLFQAQRLAREFIQAAFEVERSFEDIKTAFEFDIEETNPAARRGTFEFDAQIEGLRRRLVDIADEFQALPSTVNEVAYEMVSRFKDVDAALIATRAQVLASKVSTIDQAESLQALTAVAESYAQQLDRNLSAQERQIATAKLYAQALDGAVAVQQRFGQTVEETIEGTAGLAEVFAAEGFTLAETQAALALVILRTGSTASGAADSLGRSIGQLASPQIRNELLELAAAFDNFTLTQRDFSNASEGLERINEELDRLKEIDPATARTLQNRIGQIIGQRRETRFVAPLLGSRDLQQEAVGFIDDSLGEAERRFGFLAQTTEEIINSIIGQFQELAQNLTQLGFLTPLRALLKLVDQLLNATNEFLKQVQNVFNFLNRINFDGLGLGTLASQLLAGVLAANALRRSLDVIKFAISTIGAQKIGGFFAQNLGAGAVAQSGQLALNVGAASGGIAAATGIKQYLNTLRDASGATLTFGQTIGKFFLAPLQTIQLVSVALYSSFLQLIAAMTGSTVATRGLTAAESALAAVRGVGSSIAGFVTAAGGFLGALKAMASGLLSLSIGAFQFVNAIGIVLVAISAIRSLVTLISDIPAAVRGAEASVRERIDERTEDILQQPGVDGRTPTRRQAQIQSLEEDQQVIDEARDKLETFSGTIVDFVETWLGITNTLRTAEGAATQNAQVQLELLGLRLLEYADKLRFLEATSASLDPEQLANLETALADFQAISTAFGLLNRGEGIDPSTSQGRQQIFALAGALEELGIFVTEEIGNEIEEGTEGFANTVRANIERIQEELELGDIGFGEAINQLATEFETAQKLLAESEGQEDKEELEGLVRDSRLAIVSAVEAEIAFGQRVAGLIGNTEVERTAAQLEAARQAVERITSIFGKNSGLLRERRLDLLEAEQAYADAIEAEFRARLQIEVDSARTFRDQIAALKRLKSVIIAQAFARTGVIGELTPEEQQEVIDATNRIADIRLNAAQLQARLNVQENASTQDAVAATQANIAALQAEIAFMRDNFEEELLVREKLQELRQAQADLLLQLADRRAAFFTLTAGVGDQIAAAQAALRAANDRLAVLTNLGAAETQEGYEAQLAVLQARERLTQLGLTYADLQRRATSDITDSLQQALLDVQQAQQQLATATGPLEKLEAQRQLADSQAAAQQQFYDQRLSDLDFLFQTDQLGQSGYISALRQLQGGIDRTTRQGEELWRDIELQIRGLEDQAADLSFNIPTNIQLPTLFEVRRALAADALGVNYQDNRQQDINVLVSSDVDLDTVLRALNDRFGGQIDVDSTRLAAGQAGITIGGFG